MTTAIVTVFILGYAAIALEHSLKINKTAIALFLSVCCWTLYMSDCTSYVQALHGSAFSEFLNGLSHPGTLLESARRFAAEDLFLYHVGDACEIIFFLMGAMTIVEVVDSNGGFSFVREKLSTRSKRSLLWRIVFMTFFLSAVLDNMTTAIVMIMVLRKLVPDQKDRMLYAGIVILAANSGGAFSPIGDVTTIMLWIKGNITTGGVLTELFFPSLLSVAVPAFIMQFSMKGQLKALSENESDPERHTFSRWERNAVFYVGVGGLVSVPIFRTLTGLPPFMGILLVLSLLWIMTEIFYRNKKGMDTSMQCRVSNLLHKIDMDTILFFLGILVTVSALQETGALARFGSWLDEVSGHNAYWVTGVIGLVSSVVDNVPLVASCMGMYDVAPALTTDPALLNFVQDGIFWQLLAYCAGVGGSILIIGSAAGVVVMGLEKLTFGWYLKRISWLALIGYVSGMATYALQLAILS